jgi:lactoylglutathione lyase
MACNCKNCGGRITGLAHIGLLVSDIERSKSFYVDVLGFEPAGDHNLSGAALSFVRIGSCVIELIQRPRYEPRAAGHFDHVCLEVEDIQSLMCKLIEKNVRFEHDDVTTVPQLQMKNVFLCGPDGERLEFFERIRGENP